MVLFDVIPYPCWLANAKKFVSFKHLLLYLAQCESLISYYVDKYHFWNWD